MFPYDCRRSRNRQRKKEHTAQKKNPCCFRLSQWNEKSKNGTSSFDLLLRFYPCSQVPNITLLLNLTSHLHLGYFFTISSLVISARCTSLMLPAYPEQTNILRNTDYKTNDFEKVTYQTGQSKLSSTSSISYSSQLKS